MAHDPELEAALPPSSNDAEQLILGMILRDNNAYGSVSQILTAKDFYSFANQIIFEVIGFLLGQGKSADMICVYDEIAARKQMTDIGGSIGESTAYLTHLFTDAWTSRDIVALAENVRSKAILRSVIHAGGEMQRMAFVPGAEPADIVAKAERIIFDLARGSRVATVDWQAALAESLDVIDRRAGRSSSGETEEGLRTGWPQFDKLTAGLHKRELIILAARPSVGKTLAALCITDKIATDGGRVFFVSLEQGKVELVHRVLSKRSGLNSKKFRTGNFSEFDTVQLMSASDATRGHRVWINDGSGQGLATIISEARRLKMRAGLDVVVIDYLQLMDTGNDRRSTRNEEIGRLTRGLKRMAKELDIVVVCLAQLNRGSENRPDKTPRLADLRDSGEIEQDADAVIMLHKPEEKDSERETDLLDVLVEKQRNGPCGKVAMVHHKRTFDIKELARAAP